MTVLTTSTLIIRNWMAIGLKAPVMDYTDSVLSNPDHVVLGGDIFPILWVLKLLEQAHIPQFMGQGQDSASECNCTVLRNK